VSRFDRSAFSNTGFLMLVLSRKVGESFVIGDKIIVTVVRIAGGGVRLGIEAPVDCLVVRKELDDPISKTATGTIHPGSTPSQT
jgi:carbon storage regulator CsrA